MLSDQTLAVSWPDSDSSGHVVSCMHINSVIMILVSILGNLFNAMIQKRSVIKDKRNLVRFELSGQGSFGPSAKVPSSDSNHQ